MLLTHEPPPPLRQFVAGAHGYRVPAIPTGLHRGLPSRHLTLVVELRAPLRVDGLGGGVAAHGVAGGLHLVPARIDASAAQEGLQYAITPAGADALFGMPAAELGGLAVDVADLFGAAAAELVERVAAAAGWSQRFAAVDAELLRRSALRRRRTPPGEVTEAWRLVTEGDGRIRVEELARHVGWSRRHLSERFRMFTGLTPKQAARVARFEQARQLVTGSACPLADVAARSGYADQAHLAREWRMLAGCSIGEWLREELPFVQDDRADEEPGSTA